jgi:hypothetical protein
VPVHVVCTMVIRCGSISDVEINQVCREQGIYAHHIKQWQDELGSGDMSSKPDNKAVENRKEKALAEAAALLILQKKPTNCGDTTRTTLSDGTTAKNDASD